MTNEELITLRAKAADAEARYRFKGELAMVLAKSVDVTAEQIVDAEIAAERALTAAVDAATSYKKALQEYIASNPTEAA